MHYTCSHFCSTTPHALRAHNCCSEGYERSASPSKITSRRSLQLSFWIEWYSMWLYSISYVCQSHLMIMTEERSLLMIVDHLLLFILISGRIENRNQFQMNIMWSTGIITIVLWIVCDSCHCSYQWFGYIVLSTWIPIVVSASIPTISNIVSFQSFNNWIETRKIDDTIWICFEEILWNVSVSRN